MPDYPYTTVPGKIEPLLGKIREVGVPPKATVKWLKSVGFTSSNDSGLLPVLRYIGFIDQAGTPTDVWRNYRGANHQKVLASAIRDGYSELFSVYPDANARSAAELEHVVSTSTSAGKQAITKTVRTFQNLSKKADFSASGTGPGPAKPKPPTTPNDEQPERGDSGGNAPSLHIDIQVHISPDATGEQIDKIFASMAKHLYKQAK